MSIIASESTEGRNDVRAHRFREVSVVQWRRIGIPIDGGLMYDGVDLIGGDPWTNMRCGDVKDFSPELENV